MSSSVLLKLVDIKSTLLRKLSHPATPKKIIRKVTQTARRNARSWGGNRKREAPNSYDVRVSIEDWQTYFQSRSEKVEQGVASEVYRNIQKQEMTLSEIPQVKISYDHELKLGDVTVSCAFIKSQEWVYEDERPAVRLNDEDKTVDTKATTVVVQGSSQPTTPHSHFAKTLVLSEGHNHAFLEGNGFRLEVTPDDHIGIEHSDGSATCNLLLPREEYRFTSHDHGVFSFDGHSWVFTSLGTNTTVIKHVGGRPDVELGRGGRCVIGDGDSIVFPFGEPVTFRLE